MAHPVAEELEAVYVAIDRAVDRMRIAHATAMLSGLDPSRLAYGLDRPDVIAADIEVALRELVECQKDRIPF